MPFVVALLSVVIGTVLGMLGGGGAILMLPMLVYVARVEPKAAIATSLFVIGSTSLVATAAQALAGNVRWRTGVVFGAAAMAGAFAGGRLAHFVPSPVLLVAFAVAMLVTASAMLRGRPDASAGGARALAIGRVIALGVGVGVFSGLVGAGGGFLVVPALAILGGLAMREAIATSLFVMTMQSFAGFAGHVANVDIDWTLVGIASGGAIAGTVAGTLLGKRIAPDRLRRAFAYLVLAMGLFIIGQQVLVMTRG